MRTQEIRRPRRSEPLAALLILVAGATDTLAAQPLAHVLVVCNTDRRAWPRGGSEEIGKDRDLIVKTLKDYIPPEQLVLRVLPQEQLTPEGIIEAIRSWSKPIGPADAFLFYYSGHGNYDRRNARYFFRTLGPNGEDDFRDLLRSQVEKSILEKKPKHAILLTDCCSDYQAPLKIAYDGDLTPKAQVTPVLFEYLLFQHTGLTNITSAKPGQVSGVVNGQGSIFTLALNEVLLDRIDRPATWDVLLRKIGARVEDMFKKHYPDGAQDESQHTQTVTAICVAKGPEFGVRAREYRRMLVVTTVVEGAPAATAGIAVGDIIQEINGTPITSEAEYGEAVDSSPATMTVKVRKRSDEIQTVQVRLARP
jgi:hypothetical protein